MYDVMIIGAGPAGISAGIYAVSRGEKVLILEKNQVGGLIGKVSTVTHYAGILQGETGGTYAKRLEEQAKAAGIEIVKAEVKKVNLVGEKKEVQTDEGTFEARKIILANGTSPRRLEIPGEEALRGKGMGMNAAKDGESYRGKHIYVVGGADGAVKEALYLSKIASEVTIIHFEDTLGCIHEFREKVAQSSNISLRLHTRLHAVYGTDCVQTLELADEHTGAIEVLEDPSCGIFVYAGTTPNTELYTQLHLENGFIPTNEKMETEIENVYAVGDIRVKQVRQVSTAVADGTIAGIQSAM